MIDREYITKVFHYDPETGVFKRIMKRSWKGNWYFCDDVIVSKTVYGYIQVNVHGTPRLVHRLIFVYMTGALPVADVDHINGDRSDNRWVNLRLVDRKDNLKNVGIRSNNSSGITGVSWASDRNKWHCYINTSKGRLNIGYFKSKEDAIEARRVAEIELEYHPNHGRRPSWA